MIDRLLFHRRRRRGHRFRDRVLAAMLLAGLTPLVLIVAALVGDLGAIRQRTLDETNASILAGAEQAQARQLQLEAAVLEGQLSQLDGALGDAVPSLVEALRHPASPAAPALTRSGALLSVAAAGDTGVLAGGGNDAAAATRLAGFLAATEGTVPVLRAIVDRFPDVADAWLQDTSTSGLRVVPPIDVGDAAARHVLGDGGVFGPGGARFFVGGPAAAPDQVPHGVSRAQPAAWSPPHQLLGRSEVGVTAWAPLGPDERYRVGIDVPLSRLTTLLAQSVAGESGAYALLLASDGSVLGAGGPAARSAAKELGTTIDGTGHLTRGRPELVPALSLAASDRAATVAFQGHLGGADKAIVAAGLPAAHWALATVVPAASLLPEQTALSRGIDTGIHRVLLQAIPVALVLCLLVFLLATVLARRLVGPVGALTAAAERLADGFTSEEIPAQGDDEVGLLAHSLERMRREVNASREAILGAARELEQRVAERTAELRERNEELVALNDLAASLTRSLDPQVLLGDALGALRAFLPVVAGRGYLVRDGRLACVTHWAASDEARPQAPDSGPAPGSDLDPALDPPLAPRLDLELDAAASAALQARELSLRPLSTEVVVGLPLQTAEGPLGAMAFAAPSGWQPAERTRSLLRAVADQVALALRTAQLSAEGRDLAVLEERTRLAREIHDTLAQQLTGIVLQLEAAEALVERDRPRAREAVAVARDLARSALAEARRSVWNLRPAPLETTGLPGAIAMEVRRWEAQTGIAVRLDTDLPRVPLALDAQAEVALFRILQEALANCARHSGARQVAVHVRQTDGVLELEVRDDGHGFDLEAQRPGSFGLTGMRERARLVGADLVVETAPGRGTAVRVRLPVRDVHVLGVPA